MWFSVRWLATFVPLQKDFPIVECFNAQLRFACTTPWITRISICQEEGSSAHRTLVLSKSAKPKLDFDDAKIHASVVFGVCELSCGKGWQGWRHSGREMR
jgi:hypothetical protein